MHMYTHTHTHTYTHTHTHTHTHAGTNATYQMMDHLRPLPSIFLELLAKSPILFPPMTSATSSMATQVS